MCGKKVSEVQLAPSVFTSILRNDNSFLLRNGAHFVDEVESISCTKWSPFRVRNGDFYTEKKHAAGPGLQTVRGGGVLSQGGGVLSQVPQSQFVCSDICRYSGTGAERLTDR